MLYLKPQALQSCWFCRAKKHIKGSCLSLSAIMWTNQVKKKQRLWPIKCQKRWKAPCCFMQATGKCGNAVKFFFSLISSL